MQNDISETNLTSSSLEASKVFSRGTCDCNHHSASIHAVITRADGTVEDLGVGHNSRVAAGWVAQYANMWTGTQVAQFNYVALSQNSGLTPTLSDTTLSQEITGGGLQRVQVTPTFTAMSTLGGSGVATFQKTYTCSAGPLSVYGASLFNAASAGTLYNTMLLASSATLQTNDQLSLTISITQ